MASTDVHRKNSSDEVRVAVDHQSTEADEKTPEVVQVGVDISLEVLKIPNALLQSFLYAALLYEYVSAREELIYIPSNSE